jgi:hypothetical protein
MEAVRVAVLWRGDSQTRRHATPQNNRLNRVFEALDALGIHGEPAVYSEDTAHELRERLLKLDGTAPSRSRQRAGRKWKRAQ